MAIATACTLLTSYYTNGNNGSAEVIESHLLYPTLSYYRSQHDNQSWLAALTVIMDSCALVMVGIKDLSTFQARMTFSTSRLALVELCRVLAVNPQVWRKRDLRRLIMHR